MNLVNESPCRECPWRYLSAPGWLGPYEADEWLALARSDEPVACHLTIPEDWEDGDGWTEELRQCAGSASYRANTGKLPRNRDVAFGPKSTLIFDNPRDFLNHHTGDRDDHY